ncbi:MAG TPA: hypothetical protein VGC97_12585 [Pyrinomonadaceae bacterium]|jgi:hypothetical protein
MRLGKISIVFLLVLLAPRVFAQTTDISGKYEGTADIQGLGKLAVSVEIRRKDGKISGAFQTPLGEAPIIDGSFQDGILRLTLDAGGDDIFVSGKTGADGGIAGEISGSVGKGTFELKRTGDATPEAETKIVLEQTAEKWREDLRFLASELPKRHKNAFHRITRAGFEKMVAELDAKIPTLSNVEIVMGLARIVAHIGDGHTGLGWGWAFQRVPFSVFWFGKELRVVQVSKELPRLNGARLVKIGGVPVEKVYERARDYISQGESEQFVLNASTYLFTYPVWLKTAGLAKDDGAAVYEFTDAKGKKFSLAIKTLPRGAVKDWLVPYKQTPLHLQKPDAPFYFEYLPGAKTVYVNFRWYPRRAEFRKFSAELFDFIDKTPVEKLVFDLRQNGGGDFTRGRDFFIKPLKERKKFMERGRLFVLAGRVTFSAGMSNTADFRNDLKAIIVGEPTGARPNGYQENRGFSLPNSHLTVSYSIEFYKFSDTDTPGILPDHRIEPDWQSFAAGRDPALEWILAYPNGE